MDILPWLLWAAAVFAAVVVVWWAGTLFGVRDWASRLVQSSSAPKKVLGELLKLGVEGPTAAVASGFILVLAVGALYKWAFPVEDWIETERQLLTWAAGAWLYLGYRLWDKIYCFWTYQPEETD